MCLIITESFKIANEDIIAYKVLEYSFKNLLCTPFMFMSIEFDKLYIEHKQEREECGKIYSGVYHLFSSIDDARLFKEYAQRNYTRFCCYKAVFLIAKAIIPKGTKYYVGRCELGCELDNVFQHESYGSKSVIYKELDA